MPLPGSPGIVPASQARRSTALMVGITCSARFSRVSRPRETRTSPSWAATSATTRSLAVAVVASSGLFGGSWATMFASRW